MKHASSQQEKHFFRYIDSKCFLTVEALRFILIVVKVSLVTDSEPSLPRLDHIYLPESAFTNYRLAIFHTVFFQSTVKIVISLELPSKQDLKTKEKKKKKKNGVSLLLSKNLIGIQNLCHEIRGKNLLLATLKHFNMPEYFRTAWQILH